MAIADTHLMAPGKHGDPADLVSVEVKAPSHDGVMVPLSIVYRKGTELDGSHPLLLDGYGSYGITSDPNLDPQRLAWFEQGGIYAVGHIRGGGEYGEDWHLAGKKLTKPNTWKDFIACGEYLIQHKYTSSSRLSIMGGSAGGITVGRSITERPDLFAVAIDSVPMSDAVRVEFSPNGPPNIPEFGTVKEEDGFKALYEMSPYHHVKDGTKYPAVMLTSGINDPRVSTWEPAKLTARLQAATSSGKPILFRVDYDAGHGIGSTKTQRESLLADVFSFILWQVGAPDFQPNEMSKFGVDIYCRSDHQSGWIGFQRDLPDMRKSSCLKSPVLGLRNADANLRIRNDKSLSCIWSAHMTNWSRTDGCGVGALDTAT
jgi:prolyl oligopeptidase